MKTYPKEDVINKALSSKVLASVFYKLWFQKLSPEIFLDVISNPESKFFIRQNTEETPTSKTQVNPRKQLFKAQDTDLDTISEKIFQKSNRK